MPVSATKRVRMNELMLESLARVAKEKGITESEVLREGVRLQERMLMRKKKIGRAHV